MKLINSTNLHREAIKIIAIIIMNIVIIWVLSNLINNNNKIQIVISKLKRGGFIQTIIKIAIIIQTIKKERIFHKIIRQVIVKLIIKILIIIIVINI